MKIFTAAQTRELDQFTIDNEPVKSIDLMERAARAVADSLHPLTEVGTPVIVFAGPGNNGGDALAVARMMAEHGHRVTAYLFNVGGHLSPDCMANRDRLVACRKVEAFYEVTNEFEPPVLEQGMLVVDGLFGTGISKPLAGGFASLVKYINQSHATVASIDIPSGLMPEDNTYNVRANIIRADITLTFQRPKLSFFFAENQALLGNLQVLDIGLSKEWMRTNDARFVLVDKEEVQQLMRPRHAFAHKGEMGHALLVAGSYGMAGAAVLATRACLRSGAGKVTLCVPRRLVDVLQTAVPEAVLCIDKDEACFTEAVDTAGCTAMGLGPGLGQNEASAIALITQVRSASIPLVIDADALNMLANHRAWLQQLPQGVVMTPHVKEFERLVGSRSTDSYERIEQARDMAEHLRAYIIIKGKFSALCAPDGRVYLNPTGNAGMATAGSGDVLTGIITALMARGYAQLEACKVGLYLHGLAGDIAAAELGQESLVASDIVASLPKAFRQLGL